MIANPRERLANDILALDRNGNFEELALRVFQYQAQHNPQYAQYIHLLGRRPAEVQQIADIPFLPIVCFKQHQLKAGSWEADRHFRSSGTTGTRASRHWLRDPRWYRQLARRTFEERYGSLHDYVILALLPNYLERSDSSLVFMVDDFMRYGGRAESGFYLNDRAALLDQLDELARAGQKVLLLGVSFALLDLAEQSSHRPVALAPGSIVMETGGMKGRRREMTRPELHRAIAAGFGPTSGADAPRPIHSEYGMTELLSQAYSDGDGRFRPAAVLRMYCRELNDPLQLRQDSRTGAINCIDLANLDTISFIATDDLGRVYADGRFEILGRMDASDTRGCNLLYEG